MFGSGRGVVGDTGIFNVCRRRCGGWERDVLGRVVPMMLSFESPQLLSVRCLDGSGGRWDMDVMIMVPMEYRADGTDCFVG